MRGLDFKRDGADWPLRETSRFVEAGGLSWHVQELGEGPPALLIHGAAGATHSWRGLAPLLAPDFRLLAPDLPGHAFTSARGRLDPSLPGMARALTALLAKLDFAPRLAIGHSAGAAILARLIAEGKIKPDLFVAINGAFLPFEGFAARLFPFVARLLRFNPLAARMFSAMSDRASVANMLAGMGTRLDARGLDLYARLMKSPAHCAGALDMMANWDLSAMPGVLGRLPCPTLLVAGEKDGAVPPADADRIARLLKRAEIAKLPGLGHLAHEEAPGPVAALIRAAAGRAGLIAA